MPPPQKSHAPGTCDPAQLERMVLPRWSRSQGDLRLSPFGVTEKFKQAQPRSLAALGFGLACWLLLYVSGMVGGSALKWSPRERIIWARREPDWTVRSRGGACPLFRIARLRRRLNTADHGRRKSEVLGHYRNGTAQDRQILCRIGNHLAFLVTALLD